MHKVIILGSGNIGFTVALLLQKSDDYDVTIAARSSKSLDFVKKITKVKTLQFDLNDNKSYKKLFKDFDSVISALPYFLNVLVAKKAEIVALASIEKPN